MENWKILQKIAKKLSAVAIFLFIFSCGGSDEYYYDTMNTNNSKQYDYTMPRQQPQQYQQHPYQQPQYQQPPQYYAPPPSYNPYYSAPYSRYYTNPYEIPAQAPVYDSDYYYQPPVRHRNIEPASTQMKTNNRPIDLK